MSNNEQRNEDQVCTRKRNGALPYYLFNPSKTTRKIRSCEGETAAQLILEDTVDLARRNERKKVWYEIQKLIKTGDLGGNGCDGNAQRNGIVLVANLVFSMGID